MNLTLEHVLKQYRNKIAINDISIQLNAGIYSLIGENGAGKTTLMNMICGVLSPTSGRISYNGTIISEMDDKYRALIGYLPQDFGVLKEFTVEEYLNYIGILKGLSLEEIHNKIEQIAEELTLVEYLNKRVYKLSGGTKRRVGIAQALLNNPSILVLDEPTAGLDPGERVRFQKLLANLAKDRIVLISTHIVSDVEYMSTSNIFLKQGQVLMTGTTEDLTKQLIGKIWSTVIKYEELPNFEATHIVLKSRNENTSNIEVRFFSKTYKNGAKNEQPELEDVYLWAFSKGIATKGVL